LIRDGFVGQIIEKSEVRRLTMPIYMVDLGIVSC
jgi:hypothetical protein